MSTTLPMIVENSKTGELVLDFSNVNDVNAILNSRGQFNLHLTNRRKIGHNGVTSGDGVYLYSLSKADIERLKTSPDPFIELTGISDNSDTSNYNMLANDLKDEGEELNIKMMGKKNTNIVVYYDNGFKYGNNPVRTVEQNSYNNRTVTKDDIKTVDVSIKKGATTQDRAFVLTFEQKNRNINEINLIADTQINYTDKQGNKYENVNVIITTVFNASTVYNGVNVNGELVNLNNCLYKWPFPLGTTIEFTNQYDDSGNTLYLTEPNHVNFAINDIPSEFTLYGSNKDFFYENGSQSTFHINVVDTPSAIKNITVTDNHKLYDSTNSFTREKQTDGCLLLEVEMDGLSSDNEDQKLLAMFLDPGSEKKYITTLDDAIKNGETKKYLFTCDDGANRSKVDVSSLIQSEVINQSDNVTHRIFSSDPSNPTAQNIYNILSLKQNQGFITRDEDMLKVILFTVSNKGDIDKFSISPTVLTNDNINSEGMLTNAFQTYVTNHENDLPSNCLVKFKPNPTLTLLYLQDLLKDNTVTYNKQQRNLFENKVTFSNSNSNILLNNNKLASANESYFMQIDLEEMTLKDKGSELINLTNFRKNNNTWNLPLSNRVQRTNMLGMNVNDTSYNGHDNLKLTLKFNKSIIYNLQNDYRKDVTVSINSTDSTFRSLEDVLKDKITTSKQDNDSLNPMFNKIVIDNLTNKEIQNWVSSNANPSGLKLFSNHGKKIDDVNANGQVFNVTRRDLTNSTDTNGETTQLTINSEKAFTFKTITPMDNSLKKELQTFTYNASVSGKEILMNGFNDIVDTDTNVYSCKNNNSTDPNTQTFTMSVSNKLRVLINTTMTSNGSNAKFELVSDNNSFATIPLEYNIDTFTNSTISKELFNQQDKFPDGIYKLLITYNSNKESNSNSSFLFDERDIVNQKSELLSAGDVDKFNTFDSIIDLTENKYSCTNNSSNPLEQTFTMNVSTLFKQFINHHELDTFRLVSSSQDDIQLSYNSVDNTLSNSGIHKDMFNSLKFPTNVYRLSASSSTENYTTTEFIAEGNVEQFNTFNSVVDVSANTYSCTNNNTNDPFTQTFRMNVSDLLQTLITNSHVSNFKLTSSDPNYGDINLSVNNGVLSANNITRNAHSDPLTNKFVENKYTLEAIYKSNNVQSNVLLASSNVEVFNTFDSIVDVSANTYSCINSTARPLKQEFNMPTSTILTSAAEQRHLTDFKLVSNDSNYDDIRLTYSTGALTANNISRSKHSTTRSKQNNTTIFVENKYLLQASYGSTIFTSSLIVAGSNVQQFNTFSDIVTNKPFSFTSSLKDSHTVRVTCNVASGLSNLSLKSLTCRFKTRKNVMSGNSFTIQESSTSGKTFNLNGSSNTIDFTLDELNIHRGDELGRLETNFDIICGNEDLVFTNLSTQEFISGTTDLIKVPYILQDYSEVRSDDKPNGALRQPLVNGVNPIFASIANNFNTNADSLVNDAWNHSLPFAKDYLKPVCKIPNSPLNINCKENAGGTGNGSGNNLVRILAPRLDTFFASTIFAESDSFVPVMKLSSSNTILDNSTGQPQVTLTLELNVGSLVIFNKTLTLTHPTETCRLVNLEGLRLEDFAISSDSLYNKNITELPLYKNLDVKLLRAVNGSWDNNSFAHGTTLSTNIHSKLSSIPNKDTLTPNGSINLFADYHLYNNSNKTLNTNGDSVNFYTEFSSKTLDASSSSLMQNVYTSVGPTSQQIDTNALITNIKVIFSFKSTTNTTLNVLEPVNNINPNWSAGLNANTIGTTQTSEIEIKPFANNSFKSQLITLEGKEYLSDTNWLVVNSPNYESSNNKITFTDDIALRLRNTHHNLVVEPNNSLTRTNVNLARTLVFMPKIDSTDLILYGGTIENSYGSEFTYQKNNNDSTYKFINNGSPWVVGTGDNARDFKIAGNSFAYQFKEIPHLIRVDINTSITRRETFIQGTPGLVSGDDNFGPNKTITPLNDLNMSNMPKLPHGGVKSDYGLISFYSGGDHAFEVLMIVDDDSSGPNNNIRNAYPNSNGNTNIVNNNDSGGRGAYLHRTSSSSNSYIRSNAYWNTGNSLDSENISIARDANNNKLVGQYSLDTGKLVAILSLVDSDGSYNKYNDASGQLKEMKINDPIPNANTIGNLGSNSWPQDNKPVRLGMFIDSSGNEYILTHLMLVNRKDKTNSTSKFDEAEMAILIMDTADDVIVDSSNTNDYGAILVTSGASTISENNINIEN